MAFDLSIPKERPKRTAAMNYLSIGLGVFAGVHLFAMFMTGQRSALLSRLGEGPYKGLFSLVSLVGLALIIWGYWTVSTGPEAGEFAYTSIVGMRHVTMLLVLLAFICIGASHGKGYLKLWLRNPMSIGIALWATGHLLSNGRIYDVLMFGMFLLLAVLDVIVCTARGKRPTHAPQVQSDIIAVIVGMILYAVFLFGFHPYVLRLPVIG
jgi:uncharacterized membrane protein